MSKKHHHGAQVFGTPEGLAARVRRAIQEEKFQQALDLAKQLYKQEPQPANQQLLIEAYFGRARQQRLRGQAKDSVITLQNISHFAELDEPTRARLAEELAASGASDRALQLVGKIADSQLRNRILGKAVDAAIAQGAAGRAALPVDLQPGFDLVIQAFGQLEAAQDDAARETLQGIGLQSPFLEWKLAIRGLSAYYQNDDNRAVENWQRLNCDRLPARLIAPLRASIDSSFRQAQPPATQRALQESLTRFQGSGLVTQLRSLQGLLAHENGLRRGLRSLGQFVPGLQKQDPELAKRLATCIYWAIVDHGEPDDTGTYTSVFGPPPDDPEFERAYAMVNERMGELEEAHLAWQDFDKTLQAQKDHFTPEQLKRARAILWERIGKNASMVPEMDQFQQMVPPGFLGRMPKPPKLQPSAEKCLRKSLELAPDYLPAHEALLGYYKRYAKWNEAEKTALKLLEHYPNHVGAIREVADLRRDEGDSAGFLEYSERALKEKPLDKLLIAQVAEAHLLLAGDLAQSKKYEESRQQFEITLRMGTEPLRALTYSKWAAAELAAKNAERGEELHQKALAAFGEPVGAAFSMLIESSRLKLPAAIKKRFTTEFDTQIKRAPTPEGVVGLSCVLGDLRKAPTAYYGQKSHEKKVFAYLKKAVRANFTEKQLIAICQFLQYEDSERLFKTYIYQARRKFPQSAHFYLVEVARAVERGSGRANPFAIQHLLHSAEVLAQRMPDGAEKHEVLDQIEHYRSFGGAADQMMRALEGIFGGGFPFFDGFGEDVGYDDDGW